MLKTNPLYSLADISTIPCCVTDIESRSECNCYYPDLTGTMNDNLPIIVSPMSCNFVRGIEDAIIYLQNKVNVVLPRTIDFESRLGLCNTYMTAFSLSEAKMILEKDELIGKDLFICIDMANGHMLSEIKTGKKLKNKFGDKLKLMGGNIANPKTYLYYNSAGFDYVRMGIGGGNACFVKGTKITMSYGGTKNIEDIVPGDLVMTKYGEYQVTNTFVKQADSLVRINNKVTCTSDHEFFAIKESEVPDAMMFGDPLSYGDWVKARNLSPEYRLFEFLDETRINLVPVEDCQELQESVNVYDIEVDEEHSYIAEGFIVHNCLTSTQTSIHYPMASLLDEMKEYKDHTKIVADGGISCYSDIVKCLALGADYVMMGKIFTKASLHGEPIGTSVAYYGMSTKKAQKEMGGLGNKTSEGKDTILKKEYTLSGWTENFTDYLRSAMSYTDCRDLVDFKTRVVCQVISPNSSYAINNK